MTQTDFLNAPFPPPEDAPDLDQTGPGRFYNRELSWLGFNWRVLEEAENPRVPLLERLRFLSISANNLDEFYTVRVAGLRELAKAGNTTPAADGLTPAEQLALINEDARKLLQHQQKVLSTLVTAMKTAGISLLSSRQITAKVELIEELGSDIMAHLGIDARLLSLHEHNEQSRIRHLMERLNAGEQVALVSDAGTPGISDPGFPLVVAAHESGIRVVPVPGPSAIVAALSIAGQPTDRFVFEGFLPAKATARRARLEALASEPRTQVLYESSHRIAASLQDLAACFAADRPATLARELTKTYETVHRATLGELAERVAADPNQRRGEFVLVVAGAPETSHADAELDRILDALLAELPPTRAAAIAARLTGVPRRDAYNRAMRLAEGNRD